MGSINPLIKHAFIKSRFVLFQVFFAVLIGAFALGQAGPNMEALFTAAGAAGTIFETIDRVSDFAL